MADVFILEGHRLTGKSTITRKLRNKINYATLINPTGFPEDGEEGLNKITHYYRSWIDFIKSFKDQDILFIFDRFMFSEVVFSRLYKTYNFDNVFYEFLEELCQYANVETLFLQISYDKQLLKRMHRDKVSFANVQDNLDQISKQREEYQKLYTEVKQKQIDNLSVRMIDISGIESKHVAEALIGEYNAKEKGSIV